jgi:4-amino-4-deoxy-L-arabinose transferase-like glycosyltransferase
MKNRKSLSLIVLLVLVLAVRLAFLGLFHHRVFSGPSTQFEQAFVAINLLEGQGLKTFKEPPPTVDPEDSNRILDPERYMISSPLLLPYVKEVTGYGFVLAGLWKIFGTKLWIFAQLAQILLELLAAWGLYALAKRFFDRKAGLLTVLVFAFLFYEVRSSVIPYKDIFLLYVMLVITLFSSRIFFKEGRPWLWFVLACAGTGIGYYFMPSIVFFPFFLILTLWTLHRINFRGAVVFLLLAIVVVGVIVWPHQSYVRAHRNEPGVTPPLFWYRFWLGNQVRSFYSTEEERFQAYFRERMQATGKTIEEICKEEFLAYLKANPVPYALHTAKKLLYGTFLVYANAGDAAYSTSWNHFKTQNPQAGFSAYARANPLRILGMLAGTLSASILFPIALIALVLLKREKRIDVGLFLFTIPLYFLLLHMFFHYEARYLTGTLAGYLPLAGYVLSKIGKKGKLAAASAFI